MRFVDDLIEEYYSLVKDDPKSKDNDGIFSIEQCWRYGSGYGFIVRHSGEINQIRPICLPTQEEATEYLQQKLSVWIAQILTKEYE